MRYLGIHYDIGTTTIDRGTTRPTLDRATIERDIGDIAKGLHANAIRIAGVGFSGGMYRELDQPGLTRAAADKAYKMAGLGPEDVLQMTSYLVSVDDVPAFYAVRERLFPQMFPSGYPPNTLVIVQALVRPELLVEVQALAQRPSPSSV